MNSKKYDYKAVAIIDYAIAVDPETRVKMIKVFDPVFFGDHQKLDQIYSVANCLLGRINRMVLDGENYDCGYSGSWETEPHYPECGMVIVYAYKWGEIVPA